MTTTNTTCETKTIRQSVLEAAEELLGVALRKSHKHNYERLYVDPDGDLYWVESIDSNERQWRDGDSVPSLCRVGTGSVPCDCDWCSGDDAVDSLDDISFEEDEYSAMRDHFERELDEIPVGYFDDEM